MRRALFPILTLLFIAPGCDNPMYNNAVQFDSPELQGLSTEIVSDLGLGKSSAGAVNGVLTKHGRGGKHREPGFLWKVAGDLAATLSDEEKARLFEKMDEHDAPLFGRPKGRRDKSAKHNGKKGDDYFGGIMRVLSDDQRSTFREIAASSHVNIKAIHAQVKDGTVSRENARQEIEALHEVTKAELGALLTDEQKAQIEQNKADMGARRQAHRDSAKDVMVAVLGMTGDQVTSFDAIHQETKDATKALREQAISGDIDREALRESLKSRFQSTKESLEALFTAGQIEVIKIHKSLEMRMKRHHGGKGKKNGGKHPGGKRRGW